MYNNFPHHFLTTHRRTLPLSLVCVFVSIARRLGVNAYPVRSTPHVTAYLEGISVNVCTGTTGTRLEISDIVIHNRRQDLDIVLIMAYHMLLRSGGNIMNSNSVCAGTWIDQPTPSGQGNNYERHLANYVHSCISNLLSNPLISLPDEPLRGGSPLDGDLFDPDLTLKSHGWTVGSQAKWDRTRPPGMRFFVGQVVVVANLRYCVVRHWTRLVVCCISLRYHAIFDRVKIIPSRQAPRMKLNIACLVSGERHVSGVLCQPLQCCFHSLISFLKKLTRCQKTLYNQFTVGRMLEKNF